MARKTKATKKTDRLTTSVSLSTGYEVQLDLGDIGKGMTHLAQALIGEVFLKHAPKRPKAGKEPDWQPAVGAIHDEIARIVGQLSDADKSSLIHATIWEQFCSVTGKISAKVTKKTQAK